jgi:hypothetical protein
MAKAKLRTRGELSAPNFLFVLSYDATDWGHRGDALQRRKPLRLGELKQLFRIGP